ncbi:MAG: glycoside hydrolase family 3 protein [Chloroflexota bacterium]
MRSTLRLNRRGFLVAVLGGGAALLAACAAEMVRTASPSGSGTPPATSSPLPTSSAQPTPAEVGLEAKVGQMLLVGFRGTSPETATQALDDIHSRSLGGVVLFSRDQPSGDPVRNIVSPGQLAALTGALQSAAGESEAALPLIVAVDEEGGEVARLDPAHGFPDTESAAALGERNDVDYTRAAGRRIATTLRDAGINLNLAPVVDLDVNPDNPIIGALDRSFGADPELVTSQARAFINGHRQVGVLTTLKHFPGHGSSTTDSHLGVVDVTDTWSPVELGPYRRLIPAGLADSILTAHVFNAQLDPIHPATLSSATIDGLLRGELGYDGLVISDDMQMSAIRDAYGYADAVRLALLAGVDMLTIANQQVFEAHIVERTIEIVLGLVADGQLSEARIDESWQRIGSLKARLAAAAV